MIESGELLARARAGDEAAWREIVSRYQSLVFHVIRSHRIPDGEGEDLFQETFLRLHRHAIGIADPGALARWLSVTARNLCLDHLARRRREVLVADVPDNADPAPPAVEALERLEQAQIVREAVDGLSPRCRSLLAALYFDSDEPDYRAVAERLDMPIGSIGPTRARCLARLLESLEARRALYSAEAEDRPSDWTEP